VELEELAIEDVQAIIQEFQRWKEDQTINEGDEDDESDEEIEFMSWTQWEDIETVHCIIESPIVRQRVLECYHQWFSCDGPQIRFDMSQIQSMVHRLVEEAQEIIYTKLMKVDMDAEQQVDPRQVPPIH
jgi:hypothetical protein